MSYLDEPMAARPLVVFTSQLVDDSGQPIEAPLSADRMAVGERVKVGELSYRVVDVEHFHEDGMHVKLVMLGAPSHCQACEGDL